jgi:hypothetical protein
MMMEKLLFQVLGIALFMDDIQMYGDAIAYREDVMIKMRVEVFSRFRL